MKSLEASESPQASVPLRPSPSAKIAFADCLLDVRGRELRRAGSLVKLEPKVFDLIALLVARYREVVTKEDLHRLLWPERIVSDSSLARTIMLARQALGDASLIATVQRVGYRLAVTPEYLPEGPALPGAAHCRLAVLPVSNLTGSSAHEWMTLGLPALLLQRLEAPGQIAAVPLADVLVVLATLGAEVSAAEQVVALRRALGVDQCICSGLRQHGDTLWLDYQLLGTEASRHEGSFPVAEPGELCARLVSDIHAALGFVPRSREAVSRDPFVQQAFARAGQMSALHKFRGAAKLLEVVIEYEPNDVSARLAHVQALTNLGDASALRHCEELVAMANGLPPSRLQAQAMGAHAQALLLSEADGALERARLELDRALTLAEPWKHQEWALHQQVAAGRTALMARDFDTAMQCFKAVEAASESIGNEFLLALSLDNQAWVERERGEWLRAYALIDRASQLFLHHQLKGMAALAIANLALSCVELGLLGRALANAQRAEALIESVQQTHALAGVADSLARVYRSLNQRAALQRTLKTIAAHPQGAAALARSGGLLAVATRDQMDGRAEDARRCMRQALALSDHLPLRKINRLRRLLDLELRLGTGVALQDVVEVANQALHEHPDIALQMLVWRAGAALSLASSDVLGACDKLDRVLAVGRMTQESALSRMDRAWLGLALGDALMAERLISGLGPWAEESALALSMGNVMRRRERPEVPQQLPSLAFTASTSVAAGGAWQ